MVLYFDVSLLHGSSHAETAALGHTRKPDEMIINQVIKNEAEDLGGRFTTMIEKSQVSLA